MSTSPLSLLLTAAVATGACAPAQAAAPPPASPAPAPPAPPCPAPNPVAATPTPRPASHVYRFDFVLSAKDGGGAVTSTTFTLNLEELRKGEVLVGKNVPLSVATGTGPAPLASPRQDVGQKVQAQFQTVGDDALLDVSAEISAFEPPSTIRKIVAKGSALAPLGKQTLVVSLDNDQKHYELSVTPTRER